MQRDIYQPCDIYTKVEIHTSVLVYNIHLSRFWASNINTIFFIGRITKNINLLPKLVLYMYVWFMGKKKRMICGLSKCMSLVKLLLIAGRMALTLNLYLPLHEVSVLGELLWPLDVCRVGSAICFKQLLVFSLQATCHQTWQECSLYCHLPRLLQLFHYTAHIDCKS